MYRSRWLVIHSIISSRWNCYQNWRPNTWERKKVVLEKTKLCKRKNSLHNQYLLRFHGSPVLPKRRNTIQETTTFTTLKSGIRFSSYSFLDSLEPLLQQQLSMLSLLIWSKRGYWPKIGKFEEDYAMILKVPEPETIHLLEKCVFYANVASCIIWLMICRVMMTKPMKTQPFSDQKLSSSIFACRPVLHR